MSDAKPDKGGKKGDEKLIIIVAGAVVATGIGWGLYKTFSRSDHPLVNTEVGIKKDTANALDSSKSKSQEAKGGFKDAAGNFVHKLEDVGHKVQESFQRNTHEAEEKAQEGKDYLKEQAHQVEDKARAAKNEAEAKKLGAKKEAEAKKLGAKNEVEIKAKDAKNAAETKTEEAKQGTRGFWDFLFKGASKDTEVVKEKSGGAKAAVEDSGKEVKASLKDAGSNIKGFAQDKKEKVQDAGSYAYKKSADAKKRIDGIEVTVQKGDTLWGLSQKYNVSVESLKSANGIVVGDFLDAGDVLTIPK